MVALVIPNAGMMTLRWSGVTRTWNNVMGLVGTGALPAFNQTLADTVFAAVKTALSNSGMLPLLCSTTILESVAIRDIHVANQPEYVGAGAPLAGGGTLDALPYSVAAVVTCRTSLAGKSYRGRVYLSGWDESTNNAQGRQIAGVGTASVSFIANISQGLQTSGLNIAVLSRPRDAKTIPQRVIAQRSGQVTAIINVVSRNPKWESQRRRTGRD